MPRAPKHRECRQDAAGIYYKPLGIPKPKLEAEIVELDEFEAMRLCDLDGLDQGLAGEKMGISRGTVQRLLESGRKKMLQALLSQKSIQVGESPSCCKTVPCCVNDPKKTRD